MNFFRNIFGLKDNIESIGTSDDKKVIDYLQKALSDKDLKSEMIDGKIFINKFKMYIKTWVSDKIQHPNAIVMELKFVISQELFEDVIVESLAAIGEGDDEDDAILNGVESFITGVFNSIVESIFDTHNEELDFVTEYNEEIKIWQPKLGALQVQGYCNIKHVDENKIFNILKDDIKLRLRNKRFYFIKVYVFKQAKGNIIAECTLNNEPFYEANKKMEQYAKEWEIAGNFKGEKQYIIIRQYDKTLAHRK